MNENPFDLASLPIPTEDSIIQNLSNRVNKGINFVRKFIGAIRFFFNISFYIQKTLVGPLLLYINNLDDHKIIEEELTKYKNQNCDDESSLFDPAHLYLYLMNIYNQLIKTNTPQSIIIW